MAKAPHRRSVVRLGATTLKGGDVKPRFLGVGRESRRVGIPDVSGLNQSCDA